MQTRSSVAARREESDVSDLSNEPNEISAVREQLRPVIEAENALAQAIFLCDDMAEKQSNNHPEGNDFVTHYVIPHGLWAQVLREKQNLRHAIQTTLWPELEAKR